MTAIQVNLSGELVELTDQDVKKMLKERATEIAQNGRVRRHLSNIARYIQAVYNEVYEGRQRVLREYGFIGVPFPGADALKDKLVTLLQEYCMKQEEMTREEWEAGWESEIVPKIQALQ